MRGTPIVAVRSGPADAPVRVLATGSIHGTEPAGLAVIRAAAAARAARGRAGLDGPHGQPRRARARHAPERARRRPQPQLPAPLARRRAAVRRLLPGPSAASEPETRALMRLVRRIRPDISIHYHQDFGLVNLTGGPDAAIVRDYARRSGLPAKRLPGLRGTATGWQNTRFPQASAFVVELHGGALTRRRRAPPRPRGARRGGEPGRARERRRGAARDRLVADPVRRATASARCAPTRSATTGSTARGCSSRRRSSSTSRRRAPTGRRATRSRPTRPTSSSASARASARTSSSTATARSTSSCG